MALGFGNRAGDSDVSPSATNQTNFGNDGYYGTDAEKEAGQPVRGARKMNRIDKPAIVTADDATDPSISVGKQMEMEAGNAIKYRTCSWKKV